MAHILHFEQLASPKEENAAVLCPGQTFHMCTSMVCSTWLTILDALSFILTRWLEVLFEYYPYYIFFLFFWLKFLCE